MRITEVNSDTLNPYIAFGDAGLRPALRSRILAYENDTNNSTIIEELGICQGRVRIDLAVINGQFHGYEIKSDRDSLHRLYGQIDLYGKVLDKAYLVVGDRHIREVLHMVPDWWGILLLFPDTKIPSFHVLRDGKLNQEKDPRSLVELLWRDEALALLEQKNVIRGFRDKTRSVIWDRVCEFFDVDEIAAIVRAKLKTRAMQRGHLQQ